MSKLAKVNKRGQTIDLAGKTLVGLLVVVLTVIMLYFVLSSINPGSLFTAGSAERNATLNLQSNFTQTGVEFGQRLPTIGLMLGILAIISIIVLVIIFLRRMSATAGGGGATV